MQLPEMICPVYYVEKLSVLWFVRITSMVLIHPNANESRCSMAVDVAEVDSLRVTIGLSPPPPCSPASSQPLLCT